MTLVGHSDDGPVYLHLPKSGRIQYPQLDIKMNDVNSWLNWKNADV
jgi:hypothetical protein